MLGIGIRLRGRSYDESIELFQESGLPFRACMGGVCRSISSLAFEAFDILVSFNEKNKLCRIIKRVKT
jgi:hypothetical protein